MSSEGLSGSEDYRTSIGGDMCHNSSPPLSADASEAAFQFVCVCSADFKKTPGVYKKKESPGLWELAPIILMASLDNILRISQMFSLVNYTTIPAELEKMKDLSVAGVTRRLAELESVFEEAAKIAPEQNLTATFSELSEEAKRQAQREVVSTR